jgi:signal transduction histidine kinase
LSLVRNLAEDNNIEIQKKYEPELPMPECNVNQIKQICINLLKNAIESMPMGGLIKVELKHLDTEIVISVIDNGCGIPKENLDRMGEPFFTTKQFGTGLGLLVTNFIIKEHGGKLNINSTVGKGSQFDVLLPITQQGQLYHKTTFV